MKHTFIAPTIPAWVVIDKDYVIDIEPVIGWSFCNGYASPVVAMQVNGERLPVGNKTLVGDLDGLEEAVSGLLTSRASRLQYLLQLSGVRFLVDGEEANPWEHDLTMATVEVPTKKVAADAADRTAEVGRLVFELLDAVDSNPLRFCSGRLRRLLASHDDHRQLPLADTGS